MFAGETDCPESVSLVKQMNNACILPRDTPGVELKTPQNKGHVHQTVALVNRFRHKR
jgi:hypothetical protein